MFFGDQHFVTDFLYQTEWQKWLKDGVLTKMDVAFSRDTDEKVYVQHRMLEQRRNCSSGSKKGHLFTFAEMKNIWHMMFIKRYEIIETEGGMSREHAEAYLQKCNSKNVISAMYIDVDRKEI